MEAYGQVIDGVFKSLLEENAEIEGQRSLVPMLLAELALVSRRQKSLLIRNSPRFWQWALAEQLLKQSRESWVEDPSNAEELAELALEVAEQIDATGFRQRLLNDVKAEAYSYIGNCRRILSDLHGAEGKFRKAEAYLAEGTGDALEGARLLDLKSSLMRARRDFDAAENLLEAAIKQYRASADHEQEGRALLNYAKLLRARGRVSNSLSVLERAAELLEPARGSWLWFVLHNNRFLYLIEAGRPQEAQDLLPEVRKLARKHGGPHDRLRLLWNEGVLRKSQGQIELAEESLKQVRAGFLAAKIGYDVALVSLDLAVLYLEAGRTQEARQLATESIPLFTSRGVHREALMAWNLFREAAERDALTLGLVQEVASRIRQSQSRPAAGDLP